MRNNNMKTLHARSCDSMVATGASTVTGNVIYAKNSDRPLNEAQPLIYYPPKDHTEGESVRTSFIDVPQVAHTYGVIGSKLETFFGFEHGVNEWGLAIGNEQTSGREIPENKWGLIGMDILRLTLERTKTAREAVGYVANLLETYGTGGDPTVRIPYFNTNLIIADPKEAFIFESHQRDWVAKKVEKTGGIGNCYSLQEYDMISENAIENAVNNGWWAKEKAFDPARAWSPDDHKWDEDEGFVRYARVQELMRRHEKYSVEIMMNNLRDHYDDIPALQTLFSPAMAKINTICSHPGGMEGCITAASMVAELRADAPDELRFTAWTSMAPPCCSIFRPVYNTGKLPENLSGAGKLYDPNENWWTFIELERYLSLNFEEWAPRVKKDFRAMEKEFIEEAAHVEAHYNGDKAVLDEFSARAVKRSYDLAREQIGRIKSVMKTSDLDRMALDYFTNICDGCGMPYDSSIIR